MILATSDVQPVDVEPVVSLIQHRVWLDRLFDHPGFQTLGLVGEPIMIPFVKSFVEASTSLGFNYTNVNLWAYCDTNSRQNTIGYDNLWHTHTNRNQVLCGVMYLVNPENVGTEFGDGSITSGECWKWHLFLPHERHRAGRLSTDQLRVSLAADLILD